MTKLTIEQTERLVGLMDEHFTRDMAEIRAATARMRDERDDEVPADWLDAALADSSLATDNAVVGHDVQDVRDIIAARLRLAAGTYGTCIDCGEPIAYERLLAYPTAKRCLDCQRSHEMKGALRAH